MGDRVDQSVGPGETQVWLPGAEQSFGCRHSTEPWEIVWAHVRPRDHWPHWRTWPTPLGPASAGVRLVPPPPPRTLARIQDALLEMDASTRTLSPRAVDFALNALERAVLWLDESIGGPSRLDARMHEALLFIARNLAQPVPLASIARAVRLSPSRLSHLFQEQIGVAPGRYVELQRIEHSQNLLATTSMSVAGVAASAGFSSQFYFATRFKKATGLSPTAWREQAAL